MDHALRSEFNQRWRDDLYPRLVAAVNDPYLWKTEFRICETPVFLSDAWTKLAVDAANDIVRQVRTPEFEQHARSAIPKGEEVPNPKPHPEFIQIDFAIAEEDGQLVPKLIELQGFASMFCYQVALDRAYRRVGLVPEGVSQYFSGLDEASYLALLKSIVVGDLDPENVVLLEIEPEKQRTRVDFSCTEAMLGVRPVCLTQVRKQGRNLVYERDGKTIPIHRVYNRVIFDELGQKGLNLDFHPTDDVDVDWVAHPNWFHKLSKHSLPFLKGPAVPDCRLVSELDGVPADLSDYVLKPLYSFAGAGVKVDVTEDDLRQVQRPDATLLQRKVKYAEFLETPTGRSKAEVRLMYLWKDEPVLACTLVRVSRGALSSVSKNTGETWIGATTGYHRVSS